VRGRRKRLLAAAIWLLAWAVVWIGFVDYLPTHAHFEYMGLVSPVLLFMLPFYGEVPTADAYPLVIVPGLIFWLVIGLIAFLPKRGPKA